MAEQKNPPLHLFSSEDIYTDLKLIKNIAFTQRELDVIACILAGRKPKKIGTLLSIVTKTAEHHIHNIKQKIGCSAQDSIIDFVEKAGVQFILKKHYDYLLLQSIFESILKNMSTAIDETITYWLVHNEKDPALLPLLCRLKKDFKHIGINAIPMTETAFQHKEESAFQHKELAGSAIFLQNQKSSDSENPIQNKDSIIIHHQNLKVIHVPEYQSYHLLFFDVLKYLCPKLDFSKEINEFKNKQNVIWQPYSSETNTNKTENNSNSSLTSNSFFNSFIRNFNFKHELKTQPILSGILCLLLSLSIFLGYQHYCNPKQNSHSSSSHLSQNIQNIQLEPGKTLEWNLPKQDLQFIGRESQLTSLQDQLNSKAQPADADADANANADVNNIANANKNAINTAAETLNISLCAGLGGIGKTQLALHYAHSAQTNQTPYKLIAWFPSENLALLQQKYTEFARALGYAEPEASIKDVITYVHNWLSENPGWLLIYDNVGSYEEIKSFLPPKGGHILATSRQRTWPNTFKVLDIDVMSEQEAVSLLKSQLKNRIKTESIDSGESDEDIKQIVKLLGYLPLAIAQAGAIMQQNQIAPDEYLSLYQKHGETMLSAKLLPFEHNNMAVAIT